MMHTLEVEAFEDELLDDVDEECDESLLFDPDVEILGNSVWNKKKIKVNFLFNLKAFNKMFISSLCKSMRRQIKVGNL